jgi:hypothetical protein
VYDAKGVGVNETFDERACVASVVLARCNYIRLVVPIWWYFIFAKLLFNQMSAAIWSQGLECLVGIVSRILKGGAPKTTQGERMRRSVINANLVIEIDIDLDFGLSAVTCTDMLLEVRAVVQRLTCLPLYQDHLICDSYLMS